MYQDFEFPLYELQPSQLFINEEKLAHILQTLDSGLLTKLDPIPIKELGDETIFTDGHTRALAAHRHGLSVIQVVWDEDALDWEAYEICVQWCKDEEIRTIADLEGRILSPTAYEKLWLKRCQEMHAQLEAKRKSAQ